MAEIFEQTSERGSYVKLRVGINKTEGPPGEVTPMMVHLVTVADDRLLSGCSIGGTGETCI